MLDTQTKSEVAVEQLQVVKDAIHALWVAHSQSKSSESTFLVAMHNLYKAKDDFEGRPVELWAKDWAGEIAFARDILDTVNQLGIKV